MEVTVVHRSAELIVGNADKGLKNMNLLKE
jgi:hypothetical protein